MSAARFAAEAAERGDGAGEAYWLAVQSAVDAAPPLSPEQVSKLRILLRPDPVQQATAA